MEQSKNPYIIQYNLYTKSEASNLPSGAVEQAHRAFISSLKNYYYGKVVKEQVKVVTHRLSSIGINGRQSCVGTLTAAKAVIQSGFSIRVCFLHSTNHIVAS